MATILDPEEKETFCELVLTGLGRVDAGNAERIRLSVEFLKNISNFIKKPGMALEHLSALSKFHSLFPESDAVSSAVGKSDATALLCITSSFLTDFVSSSYSREVFEIGLEIEFFPGGSHAQNSYS